MSNELRINHTTYAGGTPLYHTPSILKTGGWPVEDGKCEKHPDVERTALIEQAASNLYVCLACFNGLLTSSGPTEVTAFWEMQK